MRKENEKAYLRQVMLFGAALADKDLRNDLTPDDFTDPTIAMALREMQEFDREEIKAADIRRLPKLMDELNVVLNGKRALESLTDCVQLDSRVDRIDRIGREICFKRPRTQEEIDNLKQKVAEL